MPCPQDTRVQLHVYVMLGRRVASLVNGRQTAGQYTVSFDAAELPSGIYLYRLEAGSFIEARQMILVK